MTASYKAAALRNSRSFPPLPSFSSCSRSNRQRGGGGAEDDNKWDVVIIGGGAVGSSIAYHVATSLPQARVCVIERDPTYTHSSTPLSAGGIRQQFSLKENIQMSLYGIDFIKKAPELLRLDDDDEEGPNLQFQEHGYLFLSSSKGQSTLLANHTTQREAGVDWMDLLTTPSQLQQRFPWINPSGRIKEDDNDDGGLQEGEVGEEVTMASFGRKNEGWFDPWSLLQALKRKAMSLKVEYVEGEVCGVERRQGKKEVTGVQMMMIHLRPEGSLVNAAGAFADRIVGMCGGGKDDDDDVYPLPIRARKRQVYSIHCPSPLAPPPNTPLVIDPTGVYFRPEGRKNGRYICGVSPPEHEDPDCESVEALGVMAGVGDLFNDVIWPTLYRRVPAFEQLKVTGMWQGFYDYNTLDQNAIIGPHPDLENLLLANGFSGHGLQHSPATGRAIAEMIANRYNNGSSRYDEGEMSLNLNRLGMQRIIEGKPLYEENIV